MSAILFGSVSTLADTSELQRRAFHEAFADHGLDWHWDRDEYRRMLERSGGRARIAEYAQARGEDVDADAVHASKTAAFQRMLAEDPPEARPGVVGLLDQARADGLTVGLVTTTSADTVAALVGALDLGDAFAVSVDTSAVSRTKPDPEAYTLALRRLGETADACVAVEDNAGGVAAATAAGVPCVAFPNANTAGHAFPDAVRVVDRVDLAELRRFL